MKKIINKFNRRFVKLCLLLLVSTSFLSACNESEQPADLQEIVKRGTLRVGTLFGPNTYYIGAQGPKGFEFELAQKYADSIGVQLEIVPSYTLKELFPKIDNGEVDILAAGLSVTPERLKNYRFSPSYTEISQKLVFKQGKPWPRNLKDLDGKLQVSAHSSHAENLQQLKQDYPGLIWTETDEFDSDELLLEVLDERIDFTIADSNSLAINRRYYPEISVGFTIQEPKPIAWVLSKKGDDSLFSSLIEFFGEVHHDGTLLTLNEKYYGHIKKFDYVDTRTFIRAIDSKLPKYKELFQRYGSDMDWRFLAAISYQESHWEPRARSFTGVRGMMMLTLPTAKQMGVTSRIDAEQSIRGGAKYFQKLINRIPARIKNPDRRWFALAAYNVGWGHMEDARVITQQLGGDPDRWVDVKEYLPLLKQRKYYKNTKYGYARGDEPVRYVENIRGYYDTLVFIDEKQQSTIVPSEQ
ncbi:membrane-bound lytic murein transglycosylase MltF [Thalassomonas sp. M1454]|uniref:membrane-bound lytic murein transglycosylase MltF n=1 Tax=Thalassomonas sp. M1454 TaxID=2594477 RepID=UPI00117C15B3|nr:membrane-bound lytic murein transglycosylase MltF [Thalassomonas sp. M1454]TRX55844.1 membrane-bound lytic murein transglycosylase MltF [Thalassomonas sp. M1454]